MSVFSEINDGNNIIEDQNISEFLTAELCEDAGIIVVDIKDSTLSLGAMNLDYIKVKELINTIENKFNLTVNLKQITSLEWETWFENTHSISVESIQKKTNKSQFEANSNVNVIQSDEQTNNQYIEKYNNSNYINDDEISNDEKLENDNDNALIDDANDEALIKLA